jgi:hypothetical protein
MCPICDNTGNFIDFLGRTSKNFNGGLKQRKLQAKSIKHYSEAGNDRSLDDIYKLYLELIGNTGHFYRRPLDGPKKLLKRRQIKPDCKENFPIIQVNEVVPLICFKWC